METGSPRKASARGTQGEEGAPRRWPDSFSPVPLCFNQPVCSPMRFDLGASRLWNPEENRIGLVARSVFHSERKWFQPRPGKGRLPTGSAWAFNEEASMESRLVRLEEIDDWEIYAKGLEAHMVFMHTQIGAWKDVDGSMTDATEAERYRRGDLNNPDVALICRLNGELNDMLMQAGSRMKRLRDRAVGLADVELDEEGS